MTTPAAQSRDALAAGRAAALAGDLVTANPYRADSDNSRERVLARMWLLGYNGGNPMPVDFSG